MHRPASTTSRGWFVSSAVQSRKLERKPCGIPAISSCVKQPRERHVGHRLASGGGEHQRVAFMRGAGTVHTAASRSTSAHRAPRTSPERAAVSTRNSNAKALAQPPRRRRLHLPDALHRLEHVGARHVAHGQLAEVREGKAPSAAP